MIFAELHAIDAVPSSDVLLAWAELWALVNGSCSIDDLPMDREVILLDLGALFPDEDIESLKAEPAVAWAKVSEEIESQIVGAAESAKAGYSFRYPFEVMPEAGVLLRSHGSLRANPVGAAYLAMQVELLFRKELLTFWDSEDQSNREAGKAFFDPYRRIFEVVSALGAAGFHRGVPVLLGESRSVRTGLLPAISDVCLVIGAGSAKDYEQLNDTQKQSNDGGVDAIIVHKDDDQVFQCVMVSATTQQSSLRNKVMSADKRSRVCGYFLDPTVLGAVTGTMTHSDLYDARIYAICSEGGCTYLSRDKLLKNIGKIEMKGSRQRRSYLRAVKASVDPLKDISKIAIKSEFDYLNLDVDALI